MNFFKVAAILLSSAAGTHANFLRLGDADKNPSNQQEKDVQTLLSIECEPLIAICIEDARLLTDSIERVEAIVVDNGGIIEGKCNGIGRETTSITEQDAEKCAQSISFTENEESFLAQPDPCKQAGSRLYTKTYNERGIANKMNDHSLCAEEAQRELEQFYSDFKIGPEEVALHGNNVYQSSHGTYFNLSKEKLIRQVIAQKPILTPAQKWGLPPQANGNGPPNDEGVTES